MATVETTPAPVTLPVIAADDKDVAFENETYVVVKEITKNADGEEEESIKAYPEEEAKRRIDAGKGEAIFSQTGAFPKALTLAGFSKIVPDEQEAVNMGNRGLKVKLQNRFRSILTAKDKDGQLEFVPTADAYSLREEAASPTQKRGLTPLEKVWKVLENVPEEQRAAVIAALAAQNQ